MANKDPRKPEKTDLFLSLEDTVEVVDNSTGIVKDGKYHIVESGNYPHKVIEMSNDKYKGIDWIEVY